MSAHRADDDAAALAHLDADVHDVLAPGLAKLEARLDRLERRIRDVEGAARLADVDGLRRRVEALERLSEPY